MSREEEATPAIQAILARSAIYKALSLAFSRPTPDIVATLRGPWIARLEGAQEHLPVADRFEEEVRGLREALADLDGLPAEHQGLFGPAPSCTPYETEYGPLPSARKGHDLADILGFYGAFGFRLAEAARDLPDHIAIELEFMSLLLAKEAYAGIHGLAEEAALCRDAAGKFLQDHVGRWVHAFAGRLEACTSSPFYQVLSRMLRRFVESEGRALGMPLLPARAEGGGPSPFAGDIGCEFPCGQPH